MQVGEDCETVTELGVMYCNNLPHMLLVTLKHIVSITSECQIDIKGDTTGLPGNGLKKTVSESKPFHSAGGLSVYIYVSISRKQDVAPWKRHTHLSRNLIHC